MTAIPLPEGTTERMLVTPDGASLRVLERGAPDAQPLVLAHGITMDATTWVYQLRDLADRFRVVAFDQRGHGASTVGRDGYGLGPLARDLVAVLDDIDRNDAIVAGHSMGAAGVLRLCRDHRATVEARVRGVVLVSAGPGFDLRPRAERALLATNAVGLRVVERLRFRPWYRFPAGRASSALIKLSFGESPSVEHIEWTRQMLAAQGAEAMLRSGFGMGDHDGVRAAQTLSVPTLLVVGSRDRLTPPRLANRLLRAMPVGIGDLEVVEGAGHQVMLERPSELAALVRTFADSRASASTRVA